MKDPKVGQKVTYVPEVGEKENGIIKSLCDDDDFVFVVYHCADDWDNYQDYTGARTKVNDLVSGWRA